MIPADAMASSDAAVAPARPLPVSVIGWIWLAASALRILECIVGYAIWRAGGLERGLPPLLLSRVRDAPEAVDRMVRHLGPVILGQAAVAAAVGWSAWKLLQLRPWARVAMEAAGWAFLLFTVLLLATLGAAFAGLIHESGWRPEDFGSPARRVGVACGLGIPALAAFGATIYFLRRADIRRAFRTAG
jgi:hypothetical protein